jgi:hypothetical protein
MWHRKVVDDRKVKQIWWLTPEQQKFFRKNRKKCHCWSCRNPRQTGMDTGKGNKEHALLLQHQDEINEVLQHG